MSTLALKFGLEKFIGRRRAQRLQRGLLQHLMKHSPGSSGRASAPLAGRRILLAGEGGAVAGALRHAGAEVTRAATPAALADQLRGPAAAHAIVLALDTPAFDGLAAARAIRAAGQPWAAVPVLGVAAPSDAFAEAAAAAGIDGLLARPVETTLLYETLSRFISGGASRLQPAAPAVATSVLPDALLNVQRLESYQRLGMLEEVVHDYLPELARLLAALQEAAARSDVQASLAALHSLLGMSGEAGAQGLYQHVRKLYVPLLEHRQWPAAADWVAQTQQLAVRTEEALKAYCARQARPSAA
jgi:two-component system CAI-1 autoinducer sensor kinase/phosphatase CqsS